jgi:hypothetical protein
MDEQPYCDDIQRQPGLTRRITRTLATQHPQLVKSLIMLACGGRIP